MQLLNNLRSRVASAFRGITSRLESRAWPVEPGVVMPGTVLSGVLVTPQSALSFLAAYAAINVISSDMASMPLRLHEIGPDGSETPVRTGPMVELDALLSTAPNEESNAHRYRQSSMSHVLGWGNSYSRIDRMSDGRPVRLELLSPAPTNTKPVRDANKRLRYQVRNEQGALVEDLAADNVLHFAGMGFDGLSGYSPIMMGKQAVGLGIAAEQFGASFFGNAATPRGFLKSKEKLTPQAKANLRESFERIHGGSTNAHRLGILQGDYEWIETQIAPEAAQFLATRKFQVEEMARLFRLPPHKLGDYSQAHMANVENANLDYVTTTLLFWISMVEAECNLKLLTAADRARYVWRHDMSVFQRGDTAARSAYIKTMRDSGAWSVNDILRFERQNPISAAEGGDKRLAPLAQTTLEQLGQTPPDAKNDAPKPTP